MFDFNQTANSHNPLMSRFENYVIDTSIIEVDNIIVNLNALCKNGKNIFLTTTTIDELTKIVSTYPLESSSAARKLLRLSTIVCEDSFKIVDTSEYNGMSNHINEKLGINDSRILQFCYEHKSNVLLLTADRAMSLYARSLQIPVKCLDIRPVPTKNSFTTPVKSLRFDDNPDYPSMHIVRQDGTLTINRTRNHNLGLAIRVIQPNGIEISYGPIYLYTGYTIMIARIDQKKDIHFSVYRVTSIHGLGKYELVFSRLYRHYFTRFDVGENKIYERFLNEFKETFINT